MALTRDYLKNLKLDGLTDEIIESIMKEHGLTVQDQQTKNEALTLSEKSLQTQVDDLNGQIKSRDTDIENLKKNNKTEELTKQFEDLQAKYKEDTEKLNTTIKQTEYNHVADRFLNGYNFTSNFARKAIYTELINKALPLENGELKGGKDYIGELMKDNADAFVTEKKPPDTSQTPNTKPQAFGKPQFTATTNNGGKNGETQTNPFSGQL